MDKNAIERCCRKAGLVPERRQLIKGVDVFIADGFSARPHEIYWRFGVEEKDFPWGCYATIWWTSCGEDKINLGVPLFFDAFHNPEYDGKTKKQARINTAIREANGFLKARERVRADAQAGRL